LLNGVAAISTGYSTFVPSYNPVEVIDNLERFLEDKAFAPMVPFFEGFAGAVELVGTDKYAVRGCVRELGPRLFLITELPVGGKSFSDYADWLLDEKSPVKLLENRSTDVSCHFKVEFPSVEAAAAAKTKGLLEALKLTSSGSLRNMHLFDKNGSIKKYACVLDILAEWCSFRLVKYEERKAHLLHTLAARAAVLQSKVSFVRAVLSGAVDFKSTTEPALVAYFQGQAYAAVKGDYSYLLNMPARSFASDKAAALARELAAAQEEALALESKTPRALWRADLDALKSNM
jgi:DNA topoisomerase-2